MLMRCLAPVWGWLGDVTGQVWLSCVWVVISTRPLAFTGIFTVQDLSLAGQLIMACTASSGSGFYAVRGITLSHLGAQSLALQL